MTMEILKTRIDEILKKMWGVNEDGGIKPKERTVS